MANVGEPQRIITVEPISDPVPRPEQVPTPEAEPVYAPSQPQRKEVPTTEPIYEPV